MARTLREMVDRAARLDQLDGRRADENPMVVQWLAHAFALSMLWGHAARGPRGVRRAAGRTSWCALRGTRPSATSETRAPVWVLARVAVLQRLQAPPSVHGDIDVDIDGTVALLETTIASSDWLNELLAATHPVDVPTFAEAEAAATRGSV